MNRSLSMKFYAHLLLLLAGTAVANSLSAACTPITSLPAEINTPGSYCIDLPNLTFSGPGNAITITTGSVNLDLQGFTISQSGTELGVNGIYVNPNLTNVHIFNGGVSGFTGRGIWYDQGNDVITLNDLFVTNNGTGLDPEGFAVGAGIHLGPIAPATDPSQIGTYVSNVSLTNSTLLRNGTGLIIFGNATIVVDKIHCDESLATGAVILGIGNASLPIPVQESGYLQNLRLFNSTFDGGQAGARPLGDAGAGLLAAQLINPHIKGCSFNNNKFNSIITNSGLLMIGIVNAVIEDNQFNTNSFVAPFPGAVPFLFAGFHTSANQIPLGLLLTSTFTLRNNEANGNVAPGGVQAFEIAYLDNMLIENNRASKNRCLAQTPDPVTGTIGTIPQVIGFNINSSTGASAPSDREGVVSNSIIRNNFASDNVAEQGVGAGFAWLGGNFFDANIIEQNLSFNGNSAMGNCGLADSPAIQSLVIGGPFPGVPGVGAGIIIDRGVILGIDNLRLNQGLFPAEVYRNLCIEDNCLEGNVVGAAGADAWTAITRYALGDVVSFEGTVYKSLQDNNFNNQPTTSVTFWGALLPATGQQYSGGLVLIGVDSASVSGNTAVGNTNGFVLTGGQTWAGQPITTTANILVQDNKAVRNTFVGFLDAQVGVTGCDGKDLNAFVANTAFKNGCNFKIGKSASEGNLAIPSTKNHKRKQ